MEITVFKNHEGSFDHINARSKISGTSGLWNTITSIDIDNDGDMDLLGGNIGLNNFYTSTMKILINDFDNNGASEQIICEEINNKLYPIHDLDEMFSQMPILKKKYTFYNEFARATLSDLFEDEVINSSLIMDLEELESILLLNNNGSFTKQALPREIQYSSVHSFKFYRDPQDKLHLICGGNNFKIKPQFGKQDASLGWYLQVNTGDKITFDGIRPLFVKGQIRDIEQWNDKLVFGINNDSIRIMNLVYE